MVSQLILSSFLSSPVPPAGHGAKLTGFHIPSLCLLSLGGLTHTQSPNLLPPYTWVLT